MPASGGTERRTSGNQGIRESGSPAGSGNQGAGGSTAGTGKSGDQGVDTRKSGNQGQGTGDCHGRPASQ